MACNRFRDNGQQMAVSTRRDAPRRGRRFRTGACRPRAASDTWARAGRGVGVRAYAAGAWLRRIAAGPVPPYAAGGYAGGVETHGLVQPLAAGGDDREARQRAGPVSVACAALHHAIRASAVQRRALVFHHARYSFGHRSAATGRPPPELDVNRVAACVAPAGKNKGRQSLAGPWMMARPERFELPTTKFVAWCSIQLSYGREGGEV